MSAADIPGAVTVVQCGACRSELDEDFDGGLICTDCLIRYDDADSPAEYLYDGKQPCGHEHSHPVVKWRAPFHTRNGVVIVYRDHTATRSPCVLPEGHARGLHYHPERRSFVEIDAADIKEN